MIEPAIKLTVNQLNVEYDKHIEGVALFFPVVLHNSHLSHPIIFKEAEESDSEVRTVIMVGNIGNGKSTTLNKMETAMNCQIGVNPDKAITKNFKAKKQISSCTMGMHCETVVSKGNKTFKFIDF